MNIPAFEIFTSNPKLANPQWLKTNYNEFYEYLVGNYPNKKLGEAIYLHFHPNEGVCIHCGGSAKFVSIGVGYRTYCNKCMYKDESIVSKRKKTNLERYGSTNPFASDKIKEQIKQTQTTKYGGMGFGSSITNEKIQSTNMDRYGVVNPMQNPNIANTTIQTQTTKYGGMGFGSSITNEKIQSTNMERYSTQNPQSTDEIKSKRIQTCLERYGVRTPAESEMIRKKIMGTKIEKYGDPFYTNRQKASETMRKRQLNEMENLLAYGEGDWVCMCPHPGCDKCESKTFTIKPSIYYDRQRHGSEICTVINPVGSSNTSSLELLIQSWLDEWGIEYQKDRTILNGQEIDIFIPSKNIGIECNGIYWHSEQHDWNNKQKHFNKYKECQSKGIRLLTLWEDWIRTKPEIVKSIISAKLGVCDQTIYARQCQIRDVPSKKASEFLNKNHIQGRCNSGIRLGMYYEGKLVALMCFSKRSKLSGTKNDTDGEWELIRYCNLLNTRVVGGASRLLKHFIKQYHPIQVTSFSCNDISDGNLYKQLGFQYESEFIPYWYIHVSTYVRFHRSKFTRNGIIRAGLAPQDGKWTERSVMLNTPFMRIHDSGMTKWILIMK